MHHRDRLVLLSFCYYARMKDLNFKLGVIVYRNTTLVRFNLVRETGTHLVVYNETTFANIYPFHGDLYPSSDRLIFYIISGLYYVLALYKCNDFL